MAVSHGGAPVSYTEFGPPERTMPTGSNLRICSIPAVHGRIALKTCCSRIRRAISCVYCPPKSSTTMPPDSLIRSSFNSKWHRLFTLIGYEGQSVDFQLILAVSLRLGEGVLRFVILSEAKNLSSI